ncbi:prepilin-type N-terminal cleavage/methylation domain-containing protein, partial [Planctomycetota bacterium]
MQAIHTRHATPDTRHPSRRRSAAGVTLVEVVIAIFILTVGVLGIISLFPTGYRLGQRAFDLSVAALAARDALPRIMADARLLGTTFYPTESSAEPLYQHTSFPSPAGV